MIYWSCSTAQKRRVNMRLIATVGSSGEVFAKALTSLTLTESLLLLSFGLLLFFSIVLLISKR